MRELAPVLLAFGVVWLAAVLIYVAKHRRNIRADLREVLRVFLGQEGMV